MTASFPTPLAPRPTADARRSPALAGGTVRTAGPWLESDGERLLVRGTTYGTFAEHGGRPFPSPELVAADFAAMAAAGAGVVRIYTVPPVWLLDAAAAAGLRVMVGLPWEQHVAFLDEPSRAAAIEARVRAGVRACAGHPAVLCFAVGNEIPAAIVRWHGARRVERFLQRLCTAVREEHPGALVTYVNYPSTEYLELPFLDLVCFNVFLEDEASFEAYVARLQNLAGDRPLLLTEIGLDSRRNGAAEQARMLARQLRIAYRLGVAGAFVFAWTDEWHRGGHDVDDWDFGLVDRARRPKPALSAIAEVFAEPVPAPAGGWPRATVVVCSYNGSRWIGECLEALEALEYPNYEIVVIDDGSTDATASITEDFPAVRLISTANGGLSRARNRGLEAATGEVIAYLDDDARPHPAWLTHLVLALQGSEHAGVGGPNLAPAHDGATAECVALAPGGPTHVLIADREAEHVPGCNMAFRTAALRAIGGFDPTFRIAGDDVDVCWRLQERGDTIGFTPAAIVWHHCRSSLRAYLRQQFQYGRAEAMLEARWPQRYNRRGHARWQGRVYGDALAAGMARRRTRVEYGTWGQGLFQARIAAEPGLLATLVRMPEWYLAQAALLALGVLGLLWTPLLAAGAVAVVTAAATTLEHARTAARAPLRRPRSRRRAGAMRVVIAGLHALQPLARFAGREQERRRRQRAGALGDPRPRTALIWSERWSAPETWLADLERILEPARPRRGGLTDRWDLGVRGGALGTARLRATHEEHGAGRQLARLRTWAVPSRAALAIVPLLALLAGLAAAGGAAVVGVILALGAAAIAARALRDCCRALAALRTGVDVQRRRRAVAPAHAHASTDARLRADLEEAA
ncbi:MAG TPA: glycosyltransferase [Baekduia sp.]|nr:glycosyltransferase [Baekduia sp.]